VTCSKCGYLNSDDQIHCVQCSASLDRFESPTLDYRTAANQVTVGEMFAGRYRIHRMLKAGGMSFVYEAFDEKVQEKIALKILKPGLTEDATTISRFQGEVRMARRIAHPNVCRIYDLEESNGVMFIARRFLIMKMVFGSPSD
jgi:serine/threonine protein kinase